MTKADQLLAAVGFAEDPGKDEKKFIAALLTQLRQLADKFDRGIVPDNPKLVRAIEAADLSLGQLWKNLGKLCQRLETLAHKQLRGVAFSNRDHQFLKSYGKELAAIMLYGGNSYLTPRDDAPRIVSVYTHLQKGHLHVGIGRAQAFYVLYPVKGTEVLCRGAVLPYYEFPHPQRLDDGGWKKLLDSGDRPRPPAWMDTIVSSTAPALPKKEK